MQNDLSGRLRTRPGWFGRVVIQVEMEDGNWRDADYRSDGWVLAGHNRTLPPMPNCGCTPETVAAAFREYEQRFA